MTGEELLRALRALPANDLKLPVVTYGVGALLVQIETPRVGCRDRELREVPRGHGHERVLVV